MFSSEGEIAALKALVGTLDTEDAHVSCRLISACTDPQPRNSHCVVTRCWGNGTLAQQYTQWCTNRCQLRLLLLTETPQSMLFVFARRGYCSNLSLRTNIWRFIHRHHSPTCIAYSSPYEHCYACVRGVVCMCLSVSLCVCRRRGIRHFPPRMPSAMQQMAQRIHQQTHRIRPPVQREAVALRWLPVRMCGQLLLPLAKAATVRKRTTSEFKGNWYSCHQQWYTHSSLFD